MALLPACGRAGGPRRKMPVMFLTSLAAGGLGGQVTEQAGNATAGDYVLLGAYLCMAVGVSFLCSLLEAALLTLGPADAAILSKEGKKAGPILDGYYKNIDRPLTAILTLNTISHTFGAAGVGAQVIVVFGSAWLSLASVIITLLILVLSEIIPKTLGATHARRLSTFTAFTIRGMVWMLWIVITPMNAMSKRLGGGHQQKISRAEIEVVTEMGGADGALSASESRVIRNLLRLKDVRAQDVMTPRNVVFMLEQSMTIQEAVDQHPRIRFSRIPLMDGSPDAITGWVLKADILHAVREGRAGQTLEQFKRPLMVIPELATVSKVMGKLVADQEHFFHVVDEFGGTAGVITLEDCVETLLGVEIVDETDQAEDMRHVARRLSEQWRLQRAQMYE